MERRTFATARSADDATDAIENAFAERESWAFEAAYRLHRALLTGAALAVLRDRAEAEDCVHDVLVRLWQRGNAYTRERGSLRAFLCVCVRNDALSRMRRDLNRRRVIADAAAGFSAEHADAAPDDARAVDQRLFVDLALSQLTDVQREAVELAYYQGLTHEQIAERLSKPVGTVKSRLSDALRALRASLASAGEEAR